MHTKNKSKFRLTKTKPTPTMATFEDAIRLNVSLGLKYNDVLECLAHIHGIVFRLRALRRHIKSFGFFSAKEPIRSSECCSIFANDVITGRTHGCKLHNLLCVQHCCCVSQESTRHVIRLTDPVGVEPPHQIRNRHMCCPA